MKLPNVRSASILAIFGLALALARTGNRPMPRLLGDVICEQRGLKRGFLFWTGGHYAWYQQ